MPPSTQVAVTLYRETLRRVRRIRAVMRPAHVVVVHQVATQFAEKSGSPCLIRVLKEHGPLPLAGLVSAIYRHPQQQTDQNHQVDSAFTALRTLNSMESWMIGNNRLYDSLAGISDREAPADQSMRVTVREILREAM